MSDLIQIVLRNIAKKWATLYTQEGTSYERYAEKCEDADRKVYLFQKASNCKETAAVMVEMGKSSNSPVEFANELLAKEETAAHIRAALVEYTNAAKLYGVA